MSHTESEPAVPRPLDAAQAERLERYLTHFRSVFQRADQFLRFRAYLRGLLEPSERKNVEAIAATAARVMMVESNLPQALQHFVSHSPWDATRLLTAARRHTAALRADEGAVWVVHDGTFAKKGQHSVGVHRQYSRGAGKKMNCQVGVFVSQIGPAGYFPLAGRLYLPSAWLRDHADALGKLLPVSEREEATKAALALRLLDELRAGEDSVSGIVAEDGYTEDGAFCEGLIARGLNAPAGRAADVTEALKRFEWLRGGLGLDHFEGRTWHGWHHHVALVFVAYGFLCEEGKPERPPFRAS
jgi:SRSO17 transposase